MHPKDSGKLWNTAVDVMALPGMFMNIGSGGGELYDEAQQATEIAATLPLPSRKRAQIHNSLWNTLKHHAMRQAKKTKDLFKFVKRVGISEEPAFEQQENAHRFSCCLAIMMRIPQMSTFKMVFSHDLWVG
jgi:hypothetical protein